MARGGARPGAGRKAGTKNKRTVAVEQKVAETARKLETVLPGAFEGDAHALLMAVYKDPSHEWPLRVDAAKAAIKFEKPALSSVDGTGEAVRKAVVRLPAKADSADQWQQQYAPNPRPN
jgi:hypothetical protein